VEEEKDEALKAQEKKDEAKVSINSVENIFFWMGFF